MLSKFGTLGGLLGPKVDHPLADSRELRRVLAELPAGDPFKCADEVSGWLESLQAAADFPPDLLFDVVRQLDDAVQVALRRLGRDYVQAARLSQAEEKRLWNLVRNAWNLLAGLYEYCLRAAPRGRVPESLAPLLCGRLVFALANLNKWERFHYAPVSPALWERLGRALRTAEDAGGARRPVQLYPAFSAVSSVEQEYLKALVLQASSIDSLLPLQIDLAEKLVAHVLPHFIFGPESRPESVYWVDLGRGQPPVRLARMPGELSPGLRFFQPGGAQGELEKLAAHLEAGNDVPADLNLGGQYSARTLLPIVRHLTTCLAPVPPQRQHRRHPVRHRMAVAPGFANAVAVFSGSSGGQGTTLSPESWVVEDVSLGGFGTVAGTRPPEWLKVGALLAVQPEGGENWLLGIVRRCYRDEAERFRVGVETLARQVRPVRLKPSGLPGQPEGAYLSGLDIPAEGEGEMRLVLPRASFDPRESLTVEDGERRLLLQPVGLEEQGADYEVVRYRALAAE